MKIPYLHVHKQKTVVLETVLVEDPLYIKKDLPKHRLFTKQQTFIYFSGGMIGNYTWWQKRKWQNKTVNPSQLYKKTKKLMLY